MKIKRFIAGEYLLVLKLAAVTFAMAAFTLVPLGEEWKTAKVSCPMISYYGDDIQIKKIWHKQKLEQKGNKRVWVKVISDKQWKKIENESDAWTPDWVDRHSEEIESVEIRYKELWSLASKPRDDLTILILLAGSAIYGMIWFIRSIRWAVNEIKKDKT